MTLVELLLAVGLSAVCGLASMTMISAYGYAHEEINNLRPLREEAVNLHAYLQDWLHDAHDLVDYSSMVKTDGNNSVVYSSNLYGWMGDRAGRSIGTGSVQIDELEVIEFTRTLEKPENKTPPVIQLQRCASSITITEDNLEENTLTADDFQPGELVHHRSQLDQCETWSTNIYELQVKETKRDMDGDGQTDSQFLDLILQMRNTAEIRSVKLDGNRYELDLPSYYYLQITGGPKQYETAPGSE
ncbi:MAG: hypothetical protein HJJLKODD_01758 [Phycisphaerae bacterium]|nr:hypothetical protein [Phycisphaerae bacterium]